LLNVSPLQEEIARLKAQLAAKQAGGGGGGGGGSSHGAGGGGQVVERVVEVEPDQAALMEQLRAQMRAELAANAASGDAGAGGLEQGCLFCSWKSVGVLGMGVCLSMVGGGGWVGGKGGSGWLRWSRTKQH
jgi:hypothetical protein